MLPVVVQVPEVVTDIGCRRGQTEGDECQKGCYALAEIPESERGQQGHEDEEILDPLVYAQGARPDTPGGTGLHELLLNPDAVGNNCFAYRV